MADEDRFEALLAEAAHVSSLAPDLGPIARRVPYPGELLCAHRFEVLHRLGEGGMGVVFEAIDRERGERGERVALKCLRSGRAGTLVDLKREFRALADLEHRNLIRLHGLHADDDLWFVTMEVVRGGWFTEHARAHPERLRELAAQLACGLATLHRAGLVHRDVKPSNVLVEEDGRVVLLDFGLVAEASAVSGDASSDGQIVGTKRYMAPEQASGDAVGPPADVYAAGVLLRESCAPGDTELLALASRMVDPDPARRPTTDELVELLAPALCDARPVDAGEQDPFVGRAGELAALREALDRVARDRRASIVHVSGESGAGKSALLRAFTASPGRTAHLLRGRCRPDEDIPFRAADGVIDELAAILRRLPEREVEAVLPRDAPLLSRLFPVLTRLTRGRGDADGPAATIRSRAFRALAALLGRLARGAPIAILVDDVQWADDDSLDLLEALVDGTRETQVLFVLAARGGCEAFTRLPAREDASIAVGPLTADESRELARKLLGNAAEDMARESARGDGVSPKAIADAASGHPLYIGELVRFAARRAAGAERPRIEEAIASRVADLTGGDRRLLEVVCLAGTLRRRALREAAGAPQDGDLARLIKRHLVRDGARDDVEPYHDRVREAVQAQISAERRIELHGAIADALERRGEDDERLARHRLGAGQRAAAAEAFERAAAAAQRSFAFDHAARLYERAAECASSSGKKIALAAAQAQALAAAGKFYRAAQLFGALAERPGDPDRLRYAHLAAEQLIRSGRFREGLAASEATLRELAISPPDTRQKLIRSFIARRIWLRLRGLRFRTRAPEAIPPDELRRIDLLWETALSMSTVDALYGANFTVRHALCALRVGDPRRVAHGLALETAVQAAQCGAPGWLARLRDRAVAVCEQVGDPESHAWAHIATAMVARRCGRWDEAIRAFDAAETVLRAERPDAVFFINNSAIYAMLSRLHAGHVREARDRNRFLLDEAADRNDLHIRIFLEGSITPFVALADDDPDEAARALDWYDAHVEQTGRHLHVVYSLFNRVLLDLHRGDAEAAARRFDEPAHAGARIFAGRLELERQFYGWIHATAELAAGRPQCAAAHAAVIERERVPWALPLAALVRAELDRAAGADEPAASRLRRARADLEAHGMPLYASVARLALGEPAPSWLSPRFAALFLPVHLGGPSGPRG